MEFKTRNEMVEYARRRVNEEKVRVMDVAGEIGRSWGAVKAMVDDGYRSRHVESVRKWQWENRELVAQAQERYRKQDRVKERVNARNRYRYANDSGYRERRDGWTAKYRAGLNARLAVSIRSMTWAYAEGIGSIPHRRLLELCLGCGLKEGLERLGTGGSLDHVVPLCQFDLTDHVQLRKAIHITNVRRIPLKENQERSDGIPEGVKIEEMPYVDSADAESAAIAMIGRISWRVRE